MDNNDDAQCLYLDTSTIDDDNTTVCDAMIHEGWAKVTRFAFHQHTPKAVVVFVIVVVT